MNSAIYEYGLAGIVIAGLAWAVRELWAKVSASETKLEEALERSEKDVRECRAKHDATKEEMGDLAVKVAALEGSERAYERVEKKLTEITESIRDGS